MRRSLVVFAALLGGASAVTGQDAPAPATPVVEERITVTATAHEEPAHDVPATVDVVNAAEIADRKVDFAIDLLRTLPGLDVVQSGSPGKAASLFTRGTNSSHTLVLWNGVELNDPYLGAFDWSTLALDGIERVEVVRGPFSALYGSGALGGVVQLVTERTAADSSRFGARLEGGSNDFLRAGASGGFSSDPFSLEAAGHLRRGDGEVDNDFYDAEEVDLAAHVALGSAARLGLVARVVTSEIGVPLDFNGSPSPQREQELDALSLAVPFDWTGARVGVEALVSRTESEIDFRDPDDPFAASYSEAQRDQARLSGRFEIRDGLAVTAGGDFERQEASTDGAFGPGLVEQSQDEWSAFGQLAWTIGPARVDVGLRRDDNEAFGAETSARLAAAWQILPGLRLRGAYGESFRAPSLADLYFPGFSNPDLQPERSESYEVAIDGERRAADLAIDWSVALFENDIDDLIEFDFATFLPQNIGRVRARGVEGSLALRRGIVSGRLAATWLDGENLDTGGPLLRRPEEKASLSLFVRPQAWTAGALVRYVGDRTDFGDVPLPSYTSVDLTLARRFGERWEPFVRVENVFDEEYEEVAGFPAPGTSFAAGVDFRF